MNQSENINLFPTLVRRIPKFLTINECDEIVSKIDLSKFESHKALRGSSISNHHIKKTETLDNIEEYIKIKDRLQSEVNTYNNISGMRKAGIFNSWINIQYKGSELLKHTHPQCAVSGAVYLKVDSDSSKLFFYNPNPYIAITEADDYTPYTFEQVWITPNIGDLVLFPSWLTHGSNGINNSEERIVLSFNACY